MKYIKGDKVRIKTLDTLRKEGYVDDIGLNIFRVGKIHILSEMQKFCGKQATIKGLTGYGNYLVEEFGFAWPEEIFEETDKLEML